MRTAELTGTALDWAVAKCEGNQDDALTWVHTAYPSRCYDYSSDWAQGGPIIESELIDIFTVEGGTDGWQADKYLPDEKVTAYGATPLEAAMRCYVASKLGDEIELPEELMTAA